MKIISQFMLVDEEREMENDVRKGDILIVSRREAVSHDISCYSKIRLGVLFLLLWSTVGRNFRRRYDKVIVLLDLA